MRHWMPFRSNRLISLTTLLFIVVLTTFASGQSEVDPPWKESPQDRPIQTLRDLNAAFVDIVAAVKPSVVTVSTERIMTVQSMNPFGLPFSNNPFFEHFFGPRDRQEPEEQQYTQRGLGSGVIVDDIGHILTNNHVVENADSIFVRVFDGRRFSAKVIGTDPKTDIAVIKIDAEGLAGIPVGNSDELRVGEMVLAVGSPMSENLAYTVTQGIVSAKGRANVGLADYEDFIQTDAAINPGNSGGPLVNLDGELVGINAAIASRSGGFQGVGFAIPVNMATHVMNSLISEGRVVRGWLGVYIQDVNEDLAEAFGIDGLSGALVGEVAEDSPAEQAGLEAGDVITAIDGTTIENSAQLRNHVASENPGDEVELAIVRQSEKMNLTVTLGELPSDDEAAQSDTELEELLGFTVDDLSRTLRERYDIGSDLTGIVVTSIDQMSNAYRAGLREGDLIRTVNRKSVQSKDQFNEMLSGSNKGDTVLLKVSRQGGGFFVAFNL